MTMTYPFFKAIAVVGVFPPRPIFLLNSSIRCGGRMSIQHGPGVSRGCGRRRIS